MKEVWAVYDDDLDDPKLYAIFSTYVKAMEFIDLMKKTEYYYSHAWDCVEPKKFIIDNPASLVDNKVTVCIHNNNYDILYSDEWEESIKGCPFITGGIAYVRVKYNPNYETMKEAAKDRYYQLIAEGMTEV